MTKEFNKDKVQNLLEQLIKELSGVGPEFNLGTVETDDCGNIINHWDFEIRAIDPETMERLYRQDSVPIFNRPLQKVFSETDGSFMRFDECLVGYIGDNPMYFFAGDDDLEDVQRGWIDDGATRIERMTYKAGQELIEKRIAEMVGAS